MRTEAAEAGDYVSPWGGFRCPKIQLLTIEDLFDGKRPHTPYRDETVFRRTKRERREHQSELDL